MDAHASRERHEGEFTIPSGVLLTAPPAAGETTWIASVVLTLDGDGTSPALVLIIVKVHVLCMS